VELTPERLEVASDAYFAGLDGKGIVVHDWAVPAAHDLAEGGWLERRFEPDGVMSWWWTPAAETALGLSAIVQSTASGQN
jgi:hypothetical protein